MVSVLALYSANTSSNPAEVYTFYWAKIVCKEQKWSKKRQGMVHFSFCLNVRAKEPKIIHSSKLYRIRAKINSDQNWILILHFLHRSWVQCDEIGPFLKLLMDQFSCKNSDHWCGYFWGNCWEKLGYFLFQNLVTLLVTTMLLAMAPSIIVEKISGLIKQLLDVWRTWWHQR